MSIDTLGITQYATTWGDAAAWTGHAPPGPTDVAVITGGTALIGDGFIWQAGSLEIGQQAIGAALLLSFTSTLAVGGGIVVGGPSIYDAGYISVGDGSVLTGSGAVLIGGSLGVDSTSAIALGGASIIAGAIDIAAGATVNGFGGTLNGNVVDNGVISAGGTTLVGSFGVSYLSGIGITGTLTGNGTIAGTDAIIGDAAGFTGQITITHEVQFTAALPASAQLTIVGGFIDLQRLAYNPTATITYDQATGILIDGTATLHVGTGHVTGDFLPGGDGLGGTLIRVSHLPTWIESNGTFSGDWNSGQWSDNGISPGANDTATIGAGLSPLTAWTVTVTGSDAAAALTLDLQPTTSGAGTLQITSTLAVGAGGVDLTSGRLEIDSGGTLTVAGTLTQSGGLVTVAGGIAQVGALAESGGGVAVSAGGTLSGSTLALTGGSLALTGATVLASALVSDTGTLSLTGSADLAAPTLEINDFGSWSVDGTSQVVLGAAPAGGTGASLAIGTTGSLVASGHGTIAGNAVMDGSLSLLTNVDLATLQISGSLAGTGSIAIGRGGTLDVGNAAGFVGGVSIDTQGTLIIEAGDAAAPTLDIALNGSVDLRGVLAQGIPGYDAGTGQLSVNGALLNVGLGLSAQDFAIQSDSHGGTIVGRVQTVACYVAGARIATPSGARPVEALRPGDWVLAWDGGA